MALARICGIFSPRRPKLADEAALAAMCRAMTGHNAPLRQYFDPVRGLAIAITAQPHLADDATTNWLASAGTAIAVDGNVQAIKGRSEGLNGATAVASSQDEGLTPERLDGDFAFAAWDERRGSLTLAVDALGQKPITYHHNAATGLTIFASEIRGVLAHPSVKRAPSLDGISMYLREGYVSAPFTVFEGISKVGLAESLRFDADGSVSGGVYVRLEECTDHGRSLDQWREVLLARTEADLRKTLLGRSHGALLQGAGLDSTAILGLTARTIEDFTIETFTAGQAGWLADGLGDFSDARRLAELYDVRHHDVIFRPDAAAAELRAGYRQMDEPMVRLSNQVSWGLILDLVRERGMDLALSGMNSGEVFGMTTWHAAHAVAASQSVADLRAAFNRPEYLSARRQARLLGVEAARVEEAVDLAYEPIRRVSSFDDLYNQFVTDYKLVEHRHETTAFTERIAARKGMEIRTPFYDWETVRFSFKIPVALKGSTNPASPRTLMTSVFSDYIPPFIANRAKSGLPGVLIKDKNDPLLRELFSPRRVARSGMFDASYFEKLVQKKQFRKVLSLLMIWLELYIYQDESILELVSWPADDATID